jgi:hypothetical protein
MTITEFAIGTLRLAGIVAPVWITAHLLRIAYVRVRGAIGALVEAVLGSACCWSGPSCWG